MNKFKKEIENGIVVVDFFAKWCEPCKLLAPIFDNVSKEMGGKIKFSKIDIDNNLEIAREYRVSSVPTVLIFKDGQVVDSIVGFLPKDTLKSKIHAQI